MLHRGDGTYLIDGPIPPGDERAVRPLDGIWRQSIHGDAAGERAGVPPIEWVPANGIATDAWPACWWTGRAQWACMGVPLAAAGVLMAVDGSRLWSAPIRAPAAATFTASSWGRLVAVHDPGEGAPPRLKVIVERPVTPPQRAKSLRVEAAAIGDVRITPLDPSSVWLAGDSSPPSAWVEIRSARSGPAYVTLAELADGPPQAPFRVLLDAGRAIDAVVVSDRAEPATAALVTIFRLIEAAPAPGTREPPPRRVFVSETSADAGGRVHVDGLGDAVYEIVAWHPRFGRGSVVLPTSADRATIRLRSPGIAHGRVLAGGKPAAGVDVNVLPDPSAFAAAEDPIDLKGGDARTGADGQFAIALAAGGGGELRVGGGTYPVKRVPLPRAPLPIVEIGDIELGRSRTFSIVLDRDPGCDVRAGGPIGRTGVRIVTATRTAPGIFAIALPEDGSWEFVLSCGRDERALAPAVVHVSDQTPPGLTFVVR
jgi:hypothetical protein